MVLLNTMFPYGEQALLVQKNMEETYSVPVIIKNCNELSGDDIEEILSQMLLSFPISKINVDLPAWITQLNSDDSIQTEIFSHIRQKAQTCSTIRMVEAFCKALMEHRYITKAITVNQQLGDGTVDIKIELPNNLFYEMISGILNREIHDDGDMLRELAELQQLREKYEKIGAAFDVAKENGYGIVRPEREDLTLGFPESYRQGNRFGIKLKASAPTYHIIKADVTSEISPIVGDEEQSTTLLSFMERHFKENTDQIWDYDIFGKSVYSMVNDGLQGKFERLPDDARCKLQEALSKILNEGSGGLICIIL